MAMRTTYWFGSYSSFIGLLDKVPDASFAWDFQKIRAGYTGNCIKVLRDSDNATMDIGFVGNVMDVASLMTFIGSDTGFVHTAYDQGLLANHAIMTVKANMPRIVNSGVLETLNGKPALRFMGNQHFELTNDINLNIAGGSTIVNIGSRLDASKNYTTFGLLGAPGGNPPTLVSYNGSWFLFVFHGSTRYMQPVDSGVFQKIMIAKSDVSTQKIISNNTDISLAPIGTNVDGTLNVIGKFTTAGLMIPTDGYMQNIMHYNYKLDALQEAEINTILNDYYGAY